MARYSFHIFEPVHKICIYDHLWLQEVEQTFAALLTANELPYSMCALSVLIVITDEPMSSSSERIFHVNFVVADFCALPFSSLFLGHVSSNMHQAAQYVSRTCCWVIHCEEKRHTTKTPLTQLHDIILSEHNNSNAFVSKV